MIAIDREKLIFEALESIIITFDSELNINYCNPAFSKTFSCPEENNSQNLATFFEGNQGWLNTVASILEGKKIHTKDLVSINKTVFLLETKGFFDEDKKEAILIINNLNIEKARMMELEGKFKNLFKFSKIAIAFVNTDGRVLMVNPAFVDYLGYTEEEFYSMTFVDFTYPKDIDIDVGYYNQLVKGEIESYTLDKRYIHKDGGIVWGSLTASIVRHPDPEKTFALGMVEDITDKKQTEIALKNYQKELTELVRELQIVNKDLESFAYSISHDLRAPLRYINSFSNMLKRDSANLSTKSLKYIDYIGTGVKDMSGMINALLEFSRLGRQELRYTNIDVKKLIIQIIREQECQNQDRQINWKVGELPSISGDYYLIKMVFENLISNAIKFTKKEKDTVIEINTKGRSIYVKDNGVGFDMKFKDKLFGVFQRLHKVEDFEGYGIGLANIKRILNRHNATIRPEGFLNQGATFYITFNN